MNERPGEIRSPLLRYTIYIHKMEVRLKGRDVDAYQVVFNTQTVWIEDLKMALEYTVKKAPESASHQSIQLPRQPGKNRGRRVHSMKCMCSI